MSIDSIIKSLKDFDDSTFPPVHLWNPELCNNASFSIDARGDWFYNNSIIGRKRLKKLFSTVLKKEADEYFLVTPTEKITIDVAIAPYIITDYDYDPSSKELIFHTNFDFSFPLNNDHPLIIKNINNEDYPIVEVRSDIEGLISRSVYYKLIDIAISQQTSAENETLTIQSFDSHHSLGSLA